MAVSPKTIATPALALCGIAGVAALLLVVSRSSQAVRGVNRVGEARNRLGVIVADLAVACSAVPASRQPRVAAVLLQVARDRGPAFVEMLSYGGTDVAINPDGRLWVAPFERPDGIACFFPVAIEEEGSRFIPAMDFSGRFIRLGDTPPWTPVDVGGVLGTDRTHRKGPR